MEAGPGPVLSLLLICAQLTPTPYPADTINWFEAARHPQIVLYAHMLFPLQPESGRSQPPPEEPWHPPLLAPTPTPPQAAFLTLADRHYAEAEWLDPDGEVVAHYGLSMAARVSSDYIRLGERQYIPHTFTHTIGTRDLRVQAGQRALPSKPGQYHVRFYVDGKLLGIAFFRMLEEGKHSPTPSPVPTRGGGG